MKDVVNQIGVDDGAKVKTFHGHAKIILTDVHTGKEKVVEHDNTFQTTFLEKQLRSLGSAYGTPWRNSGWTNKTLMRNLCGGIYLFRDAITAPCEYMPNTNVMVGNSAYGVSNSGTPVEMGSYNSVESSIGTDSATFVYDWGTSQGNGTIGCICLTSEVGGYIGYGNSSGVSASTKKSLTENQTVNWYTPVIYDNKKYSVGNLNLTAKTFDVWSRVDDINKTSIFSKWDVKHCSYTGNIIAATGTDRIQFRQISPTKIAISNGLGVSLNNGNTGRILTFDVSTEAVDYITIVNTCGENLVIVSSNMTGSAALTITLDTSGNVYVPTYSNNKIAKFNSSGVFVDFVDNGNTTGYDGRIGRITPNILIWAQKSNRNAYFFDGTTERITNGTFPDIGSYATYIEYCDALDLMLVGNNDSAMPFKNPMYLATINNLDSAVTKDNTQTMKVIYTLTET